MVVPQCRGLIVTVEVGQVALDLDMDSIPPLLRRAGMVEVRMVEVVGRTIISERIDISR